jgi:hypothetical protein
MKKQSKNLIKISLGISFLISLMLSFPAIVDNYSGETYSGLDIAFGKNLGFAYVNMNFFALLGFLLPLLVSLVGVMILNLEKYETVKYVRIALGLSFLLSAFSLFTVLHTEISFFAGFLTTTFARHGSYSIGIGSIIGACLALLGLFVAVLDY